MMLLCKLAAAVLVAAVLTLLLKKDQPAFAFLVSVCTAAESPASLQVSAASCATSAMPSTCKSTAGLCP